MLGKLRLVLSCSWSNPKRLVDNLESLLLLLNPDNKPTFLFCNIMSKRIRHLFVDFKQLVQIGITRLHIQVPRKQNVRHLAAVPAHVGLIYKIFFGVLQI